MLYSVYAESDLYISILNENRHTAVNPTTPSLAVEACSGMWATVTVNTTQTDGWETFTEMLVQLLWFHKTPTVFFLTMLAMFYFYFTTFFAYV